MHTTIQRCRICGNTNLASILDLGVQSLTGIFPRHPSDSVSSGPLELVKCHGDHASSCGLVQLRNSFESSEMYGENYGYRSSLNRSMVRHLKTKAENLIASTTFQPGDIVLDIGSNDGTSLSFYPHHLTLVGMDPTAAKFLPYYQPHIHVIPDFFSAASFRQRFGQQKARIITSIAMFYDLEDPLSFVAQIAEILADDGIWHFEMSYLPTMLSQNAYDTVCHEHIEYYALRQIQWLTDRCGLKITDAELNDINGGSIAVTVSKNSSPNPGNPDKIARLLASETEAGLHTLEPYADFQRRVHHHRDQLATLVHQITARGETILGYGASTKGNVILQFAGLDTRHIPAIAEVNQDKFGCFTPGTHIPIISETEAHARNPDYLLVLPWHFRPAIIEREAQYLRDGGKLLFPLPQIEIIEA